MPARRDVTYDGYDLQNATVGTRIAQHTHAPDRALQIEDLGREDKSVLASSKYVQKIVTVEGYLKEATTAALQEAVDNLKDALDTCEDANLDISWRGTIRRYLATPSVVEIPEDYYNLTWIPYRIEFVCAEPFGRNTSEETRSWDSLSTAEHCATFTADGNFRPEPIFEVDVEDNDAITWMRLTNTDTGDWVQVGTVFADGDEVDFDHINKKCLWNSDEIDYTGLFPLWYSGSNKFCLTHDGGTETTVDLDIRWTPRWL